MVHWIVKTSFTFDFREDIKIIGDFLDWDMNNIRIRIFFKVIYVIKAGSGVEKEFFKIERHFFISFTVEDGMFDEVDIFEFF
jgi:hypothetical protein